MYSFRSKDTSEISARTRYCVGNYKSHTCFSCSELYWIIIIIGLSKDFKKAHQSCDIQSVHRISVKCKHFVGCYLSSLTRRNVYVRYINILNFEILGICN